MDFFSSIPMDFFSSIPMDFFSVVVWSFGLVVIMSNTNLKDFALLSELILLSSSNKNKEDSSIDVKKLTI